jgi:hypothetical protein
MGAAADRLWTCGQRKRVAHRVHSSQQQTQKIATASIRSKETRNLAVRSHAVPNCQQNAHRFLRGGQKGNAALFEQEIQNGTDPDLKEFARQTLPKIVDHLQRAEKLAAAASGRVASK